MLYQLYSVFEDKKHMYLVLEYCQNGKLNDYIKSKGLKECEG